MAVTRDFLVKLFADPKQVISAFKKVSGEANDTFGKQGLGGKLTSLLPSFKTVGIAGTAAFGAVTAAAGFAIKAAAEDAESQARLAQALKNTFGESEALVTETEKLITQFSKSAAVADDQLRPAFGTLVTATGDFAQSQKLLSLALDISAGTGRDLESVTIALARASQGTFTQLTRLGVPLDAGAVKTKNFAAVTKQLGEAFEGQAEAKADSAAGRFRAFGIAVDELKEQFGTLLLPTVITFTDFLTNRLIPAVSLAVDQFRSSGVKAGLAFFVAAFGEAGKAVLVQIEAIGQGIFSFLGNVVSALRPLFAAIDLVRAFLAFGKPIVSIEGMIQQASDGMAASFASFSAQVDYASKKLDIISKGPMDTVERKLAAVTAKAKGAKGGLDDFGDEAEKAGGKVGKAGDKIKTVEQRLSEFTSASKKAKSASDAFGRSQKNVEKAQLSVDDATRAVAKAQQELLAAQQGGSPAEIEAAQRKVAAAERGLARSKFGVEESIIAVKDAEKALAALRANPEASAEEIRKAEIDLAEAQFDVADAQDSLIDQTTDLEEARRLLRIETIGLREGDEELLPFQDAVTAAQIAGKEAADELTEAIAEQTEQLNEYIAALKELDAVKALFPKISAANPVTGLVPVVPAATSGNGGSGGQRNLPDKVEITVNSSIVNPLQVAQEIQDYLDQLNRAYGTYSV
jgi:hypothetical protein